MATVEAPGRGRTTEERARFRVGDCVRANLFAPADLQGRRGFITEAGPGDSEYRVEFEDNRTPTTGYLMSWWLEAVDSPR